MAEEEVLVEAYWVEIPCVDEEAALRLADHLRAFEPRVTRHKLVKTDDANVVLEREQVDPMKTLLDAMFRRDEDGQ